MFVSFVLLMYIFWQNYLNYNPNDSLSNRAYALELASNGGRSAMVIDDISTAGGISGPPDVAVEIRFALQHRDYAISSAQSLRYCKIR